MWHVGQEGTAIEEKHGGGKLSYHYSLGKSILHKNKIALLNNSFYFINIVIIRRLMDLIKNDWDKLEFKIWLHYFDLFTLQF